MNNNREILKKYLDVYKTQIFTKLLQTRKIKNCQYYYCSYDCRNLVQNKIATLVDILKVLTY